MLTEKNTFANLRFGFLFTLGDPLAPSLAKDQTFSGFFFGNLPLQCYLSRIFNHFLFFYMKSWTLAYIVYNRKVLECCHVYSLLGKFFSEIKRYLFSQN